MKLCCSSERGNWMGLYLWVRYWQSRGLFYDNDASKHDRCLRRGQLPVNVHSVYFYIVRFLFR